MPKHILITGGAGFIGSHLVDELLRAGRRVRVLDNLSPEVHGAEQRRPGHLDANAELIVGDVRDRAAVDRALDGVDSVVHLAAVVGVGQSMYEIERYTSNNELGTAVLMEALLRRPVERLVVASSMSVYGEGLYQDARGTVHGGARRTLDRLRRGEWDLVGPAGEKLEPVPTPETKCAALESVYALSKYQQERLCLLLGRAYRIPTVALRFFNVYGPRQALSNPYTGVLAIFAARLLNDSAPLVFEDGFQRRDFVNVHDVARACWLALEADGAEGEVINVGSGSSQTVASVAAHMAQALGKSALEARITGEYRVGDVRHCFADVRRARELLQYEPQVAFEEGIAELAGWLDGQIAHDHVAEMRAELATRGLMR